MHQILQHLQEMANQLLTILKDCSSPLIKLTSTNIGTIWYSKKFNDNWFSHEDQIAEQGTPASIVQSIQRRCKSFERTLQNLTDRVGIKQIFEGFLNSTRLKFTSVLAGEALEIAYNDIYTVLFDRLLWATDSTVQEQFQPSQILFYDPAPPVDEAKQFLRHCYDWKSTMKSWNTLYGNFSAEKLRITSAPTQASTSTISPTPSSSGSSTYDIPASLLKLEEFSSVYRHRGALQENFGRAAFALYVLSLVCLQFCHCQ